MIIFTVQHVYKCSSAVQGGQKCVHAFLIFLLAFTLTCKSSNFISDLICDFECYMYVQVETVVLVLVLKLVPLIRHSRHMRFTNCYE